ncbi:MAG: hypothetical protein ABJN42_07845 [Roseibium sp.]|uniref:hypothetical protein n=1 Tax=Roseibium sp. TaxID=1936156 RepID=UPI003297EAFA
MFHLTAFGGPSARRVKQSDAVYRTGRASPPDGPPGEASPATLVDPSGTARRIGRLLNQRQPA